jgi:Flp pilus assembly protein TadD
LQQAIRLDPSFALAYSTLAFAYSNLGQWDLAADNARAAYELSHNVSERERFFIEAAYHENVDRNYQKARQVFQLQAETYPRDWVPWHDQGWICMYFGQHEMALELFHKGGKAESCERHDRDGASDRRDEPQPSG